VGVNWRPRPDLQLGWIEEKGVSCVALWGVDAAQGREMVAHYIADPDGLAALLKGCWAA
jgi:hypothetical protein